MEEVGVLRVVRLDLREVLIRETPHRLLVTRVARVPSASALIIVPEPLGAVTGDGIGAPVDEDAL